MSLKNAVVIPILLLISGAPAQLPPRDRTPKSKALNVTPGVILQLPANFTLIKTGIRGLSEIFVKITTKQSAEIKVTVETRRSEKEAVARLLRVAEEADGQRAFVEICGWPALERQYQVRLAEVMMERSEKPLGEAPVVQAATIA